MLFQSTHTLYSLETLSESPTPFLRITELTKKQYPIGPQVRPAGGCRNYICQDDFALRKGYFLFSLCNREPSILRNDSHLSSELHIWKQTMKDLLPPPTKHPQRPDQSPPNFMMPMGREGRGGLGGGRAW